jgi:hypothetical protein
MLVSACSNLPYQPYSNLWSWVPRDWEPRITGLARTSTNLPDRRNGAVICICVCVWRNGQLVSECPLESPPSPIEEELPVIFRIPFLVEEVRTTILCLWGPAAIYPTDLPTGVSQSVSRERVLRQQLKEYEVGVRWSSPCEDVSPGAEERRLLEHVSKQHSEVRFCER